MIAQQLKQAFDPYYQAPLEAWEEFARHCEEKSYPKNEVIKQPGTADQYGYFLMKGAVGLFTWKENSNACLDLFVENSFFADDLSLITGRPSPVMIQALEHCSLLRIHRAAIEKLKHTPMGSLLFLAGEQQAYAAKQQQQIELMSLTAEERYLRLLDERPELVSRIHQKHLASLLGITTQSLSRIRKKIFLG